MKETIIRVMPDQNGDEYAIRHNKLGQLSTIWVNGRIAMNVAHYDVLLDNDRTTIRLLVRRDEDESRLVFDGLKLQDGALLGKVTVEFKIDGVQLVVKVGGRGMVDSVFPTDWPWPNANSLRITGNLRGIQRVEVGLVPDNTSPGCNDEDRKQGRNLLIAETPHEHNGT